MINNCDICKNKEKCSKFKINSKEWNNLTCYNFNEISSPQLVEHIIKNFCKDEHRDDLWINIEAPLYKTLKALEIIKEHCVKIGGTRGNFEGKNPTNEIVIVSKDLTQEEFDLLKEVLLWKYY